MRVAKKKQLWVLAIFICFSLAIPFSLQVGHAQERTKGELGVPWYYPDEFDGYGRIDRIAASEVVIDDSLYGFSPDIQFYVPTTIKLTAGTFRAGRLVGFLLDSQGRIASLWLIQ